MRVRLSPAAQRDLREVEEWYMRASPAVAKRFRGDLRAALQYIGTYPLGSRTVESVVRGKPLHRFPFSILYIVLPDRVRVVAIADDRRGPGTYNARSSD